MKSTKPTEMSEFDAIELGGVMRETRENLGFGLEKVANDLRIRSTYLEAIEAGRFSELPGNAYVVGFLRVYSDYLGLNGQDVVQQFKMAGTEIINRPELHLPSPLEDGRMPTVPILVIGIIIAAFAYVGWDYLSSPSSHTVQIKSQSPDKLSKRSKSLIEKNAMPSTISQVDTASPPRAMPPVVAKSAGTASANRPGGGGGITQKSEYISQSEPDSEGLEPKDEILPSAASMPSVGQRSLSRISPAIEPSEALIVLLATDHSYVAIKNNDTETLFAKLMHPGDRYEVPLGGHLILETGNAGGLQIFIGDKLAPTLGDLGEVIRDIPLSSEWLLGARN